MNPNTFRFQAQPLQFGWGGKLLAAVIAALLLVGGFFFGLLLLAVGGAIVTVAMLKLWWISKKLRASQGTSSSVTVREGHVIDAEYQVKQDPTSR